MPGSGQDGYGRTRFTVSRLASRCQRTENREQRTDPMTGRSCPLQTRRGRCQMPEITPTVRAVRSPASDVGPKLQRRQPAMPRSQRTRPENRLFSDLCTLSSAPPQAALVGLGRLERPTSRLSGVRSNQLSYRPSQRAARRRQRAARFGAPPTRLVCLLPL
jgi:hypothetical protein